MADSFLIEVTYILNYITSIREVSDLLTIYEFRKRQLGQKEV